MAIDFNKRTRIMAGVLVLALGGAGAAAWFLYFDEPPPPRRAAPAVAKAAPKPASDTAKNAPADAAKPAVDAPHWADAAKPAAEAPKQADAAKPVADAPKQADAAKAAAAPKPGAKPNPTNPDQLIAEIVDLSGVKAQMQSFGRGVAMIAIDASQSQQQQKTSDADSKAMLEISARIFEPEKMTAEVATSLKAAYNADRMTRFLELLRQPVALKIAALEARQTASAEMAQLLESLRKNPPPAGRQKLVMTLDEITQDFETGVQLVTLVQRETVDALFTGMQKAGKQVPREARQTVGSKIVAAQGAMRSNFRNIVYLTYRDASDEELAQYVKLVDTDTGRWGSQLLASAQRSAIEGRVRGFAREMAQVALSQQALAKVPAPKPVAPAPQEKPAAPAAVAPAAPAEPPGYKRGPNVRELYSRYNDLISATVMRESAAVKELLDDGKDPNARQRNGFTPLMIAASNGDTDIAAMLLAKGADPNPRAGGTSALSIAKARGSAGAAMVQLLERSGARD